jgi:hypothetical protein
MIAAATITKRAEADPNTMNIMLAAVDVLGVV